MKKRICFPIIGICMLILMQDAGAQTHMKNATIGIQYVGSSDKPVKPIILAESIEDAKAFKNGILQIGDLELASLNALPRSLLRKLISIADKHHGINPPQKSGSDGPPSVSIVVVSHNKRKETVVDSKDAVEILERFERICRSHPELQSDLISFRDRIER